jgi:GT2 family glycosyltransferase
MKLSVVVPVHNGGADLRACLAALARSTRKPDEIIVVDDGSSDGAAAGAAEFAAQVVVLEGEPHGPAFARNRGAARAKGDVLVFVDADVEVHADTLARFEGVFRDDATLAAAFGSYDDRPPAPGRVSRYKNLLHHYVHQHGAPEAETFWAGCGAIRRESFTSSGGFCESYRRPSIEDIELGVRLRAAGRRIRLCPEIQCTHRKRWTLGSLLRTDILGRAVPWTRLILQQGRLPSGLNTDGRSRWSALLTVLLAASLVLGVAGVALGWRASAAAAAGGACLASLGVVVLNLRLYRFFFDRGGIGFGLGAVALHFSYLLYSAAVFTLMFVYARVTAAYDGVPAEAAGTKAADRRPAPRRRQVAGGILFLSLFAVYVADGEPLPGNDATPNVHLAANLLARGTLVYTPETDPFFFQWTLVRDGPARSLRFRSWDEQRAGHTMRELFKQGMLRAPEAPYYLSRTTAPGVYVSSYGPATGLFALPFVAAAYPFVENLPQRPDLLWRISKLAAAFAVAASAWFLFLIAADFLRLSTAVMLALAYGLATSVWSVSSQALWQHAPGEFFLALGMYCLFRVVRGQGRAPPGAAARGKTGAASEVATSGRAGYAPYLAGLAFALAFLCRPTNSLAVIAGFVVLLADRRALLRYVVGGAPVAALFFAYNLHYFGQWIAFGQVSALAERARSHEATAWVKVAETAALVKTVDTMSLWRISLCKGLAGVLISPSRGLFVFSPIFVVSVWGALRIWRDRRWLPLRAAALATLGIWLVVARWAGWWGGWSYGYRLVVDTAILLALLAIPVAERIRARRSLSVVAGVLLLWSVGVQALGVLVYDVTGWNNREGYAPVDTAAVSEKVYFLTSEEAAAYCQPRRCSFAPTGMSVDSARFNSRLWRIRDSQILYYLQNLKRSHANRKVAARSFLSGG